MADVSNEMLYVEDLTGATTGTSTNDTADLKLYTVLSGRQANIITMWVKCSAVTAQMEIYHDVAGAGPPGVKIWRKEDGLDTPPLTEFHIDFLTRYMNGLVMEATDELNIRITTLGNFARTVTAGAWISLRDA